MSTTMPADDDRDRIAVIGMAARFPGADTVDEFWDNLVAGRESIRPISDDEFLSAGGDPTLLDDPGIVRMASVIEGIDRFDATFFGYSAAEAAVVDPQQRILLECAVHALEDSGYLGRTDDVEVGVYAGAGDSRYYPAHVYPRFAGHPGSTELVHAATANSLGTLATRVSYELGFTGPSLSLQTACSTALVAIHTACQDLLSHRCDAALAGAVSINPSAMLGYRYLPDSPFSPDGRCRTFDADAAGTSSGDGVGVVVLKRLADALADGDRVRAVIRGSAINNDGRRKVGFSAPSSTGQFDAVLTAQVEADVDADSIGYVEAHGTATRIGDPIEVDALTRVFRESTDRIGFCALGSVKPNIGHLGAAAGIAGFVKAVLALEHAQIPPTIHLRTPNPLLDLTSGPFRIPTRLEDWPRGAHPRRAGVSAFGIGGTNAHVIVEEMPASPSAVDQAHDGERTPVTLRLSAAGTAALRRGRLELAAHLTAHPELTMAQVADALVRQRPAMAVRSAIVAPDIDSAIEQLGAPIADLRASGRMTARIESPPVAFLVPGGGTQYAGMGAGLYRDCGPYRDAVDRCADILRPVLGHDIRTTMQSSEQAPIAEALVSLTVTEYALGTAVLDSGVEPTAMIGHSLGEYTVATLAGVIDLEEMLPLVALRLRLIAGAGGAGMAVALAEDDVSRRLTSDLSLAAVNGPTACTVAGTASAVEKLERELAGDGIYCRRLAMPVAPHSHLLDPILDDYAAALGRVALRPPRVPYVTNVTGTWVTDAQATSVAHWVDHTRRPVRFRDGLTALWERHSPVFLELGPGDVLSRLSESVLPDATLTTIPTMGGVDSGVDDIRLFAEARGRLWDAGVESALPVMDAAEPTPIRLPLYAFDRTRHWIDAPTARPSRDVDARPTESITTRSPRPALRTDYVEPVTDLGRAVAEQWQDVLGVEPIGLHDDYFDMGGDSMRAVMLAGRLTTVCGVHVTAAAILAAPTVSALLSRIDSDAADSSDLYSPVVALRSGGSRPPLICIHPVGGIAWRYFGLLPHLDPDQPVYGIQAHGLDGETPLAVDADDMLRSYLAHVRDIAPTGPYRLLGWSYGGFVAHALATALQRDGETVELLAMLDAPLPDAFAPAAAEVDRQVAGVLSRLAGDGTDMSRTQLAATESVIRNNLDIGSGFRPEVFDGDILYFSATGDASAPTNDQVPYGHTITGWAPFVSGHIREHELACSHFAMTDPEPIASVGRAVDDATSRVLR